MSSLELDKILERAYYRTKERWVKAVLTWGLSCGIVFFVSLISLLVAGLLFFIFFALLKPLAILGLILGIIVFLGGFIWATSWTSLAYTKTIVSESPIGPFKALAETKPLAFPYLGFLILYFFFMLGLLPYLGIPFILWLIWGIFYIYVFLSEPEARGGLKPLWRSRELVRGNAGKVFLVMLLFFGISFFGSILSLSKSSTVSVLWYLFSMFFITPFSTSVYWEMYKDLSVQKGEVKAVRPMTFIVLSVVGLLIMVGFLAVMARGISKFARKMNLKRFIYEIRRKKRRRHYPYKFKIKPSPIYDSTYDFYDGEF